MVIVDDDRGACDAAELGHEALPIADVRQEPHRDCDVERTGRERQCEQVAGGRVGDGAGAWDLEGPSGNLPPFRHHLDVGRALAPPQQRGGNDDRLLNGPIHAPAPLTGSASLVRALAARGRPWRPKRRRDGDARSIRWVHPRSRVVQRAGLDPPRVVEVSPPTLVPPSP